MRICEVILIIQSIFFIGLCNLLIRRLQADNRKLTYAARLKKTIKDRNARKDEKKDKP